MCLYDSTLIPKTCFDFLGDAIEPAQPRLEPGKLAEDHAKDRWIIGDIVTIRPDASSNDRFWIAMIIANCPDLMVKVHWYAKTGCAESFHSMACL